MVMSTADDIKKSMMDSMSPEDTARWKKEVTESKETRQDKEIVFYDVLLGLSQATFQIRNLPKQYSFVEQESIIVFNKVEDVWRLPQSPGASNSSHRRHRRHGNVQDTAYRVSEMLGMPGFGNGLRHLGKFLTEFWNTNDDSIMLWRMNRVLSGVPPHVRAEALYRPIITFQVLGIERNERNFRLFAQSMLDVGINPTVAYGAHASPAMVTLARSSEEVDMLPVFVEHGYSINTVGSQGMTPFLMAATSMNETCLEVTLAFGADPHAVNAIGQGAMHLAIEQANGEDVLDDLLGVMQLLADAGVRADLADAHGRTPVTMMKDLLEGRTLGRRSMDIMFKVMSGSQAEQEYARSVREFDG